MSLGEQTTYGPIVEFEEGERLVFWRDPYGLLITLLDADGRKLAHIDKCHAMYCGMIVLALEKGVPRPDPDIDSDFIICADPRWVAGCAKVAFEAKGKTVNDIEVEPFKDEKEAVEYIRKNSPTYAQNSSGVWCIKRLSKSLLLF